MSTPTTSATPTPSVLAIAFADRPCRSRFCTCTTSCSSTAPPYGRHQSHKTQSQQPNHPGDPATGGGYTPERQAAREWLRLEAAERFERGDANGEIARDLRVSERAVRLWRKDWREAGRRPCFRRGRYPARGSRTSSGPGWRRNCGAARWRTVSRTTSGGHRSASSC
ncbi:helix-turn-helix domain-containing protein [Streptomyces sioyaensis]|uniref:helix-turn-helix domain-containing protein n=1 Tax=Streptomyces sioyaensis TaxID=67364 RepID=UPI003F54143E